MSLILAHWEKERDVRRRLQSRPSNSEGILEMLEFYVKGRNYRVLAIYHELLEHPLAALESWTSNFSALDQMGRAYQLRIHALIRFCCLIMPTTTS